MTAAGQQPNSAVQRVDVITVNYHSEDVLLRLVASVRELASRRPGTGLIVVDCGGLAGSTVELDGSPPLTLTILDAGGNVGFASAVNIGLAATTAETVVLANPDLDLDAAATDHLLDLGLATKCVAWTGVLHDDDGSIQRNTAPLPALRRHLAEYLLSVDTRLPPSDQARAVPVITGAFMCARTAALRSVHGMDERYPLYVEDVDLCVRLREVGTLLQFPVHVGTHTGGVSARRASRPSDLEALIHASWVAWFRRRSRLAGATERAGALAGCGVRQLVRRGPIIDMGLLWRATAPGFDLRSLLPGSSRAVVAKDSA